MSVDDKVTIISGASGGLGQTVSEIFYQAGAKVVLIGTSLDKVQDLANTMESSRALPLAANLMNADGAEAVVQATLDKFGRVDILLNLAGGFTGGTPVHESDGSDLDKMLAINLRTVYNMSQAAVKPMIDQQWGRIVNTASHDAQKGRAKFSAYGISKAAVLRLTESMAAEVKPYNVIVNALLLSAIDTEANRKAMPNADPKKWLKPATIAKTLLFLCSDDLAIYGAGIPLEGKN
ncbi:MAG: SDR family NAD(P)-dependent oxidoreductase [Anaerolineae bacterium]|nr:SDR family NAD(P)-dependent oxidoreductase [Anaerolineae bacterium]